MNYQDMLNLKKGDRLEVYSGGGWITGTVNGSHAGTDPAIWLEYTKGQAMKVYTGSNFTESAWYKNKYQTLLKFEDEFRESLSMSMKEVRFKPNKEGAKENHG